MESIYFERLIEDDTIPNKALIQLSELRRKDFSNIENALTYYKVFCKISDKVRYKRVRLSSHPKFKWGNVVSTNWNIEKLHLEDLISEKYIQLANEAVDEKEKLKLCNESITYRTLALSTMQSCGWITPLMRLNHVTNERYHLHKLFEAVALKYFSIFSYKQNDRAILLAYQFDELSSRLWKSSVKDYKYMALALHSIATKMSDDEIGERIALLDKVINKNGVPANVTADYQTWVRQNEQVYFNAVQTKKKLETLTLNEAFCIVLPPKEIV